MRAVDSFVLLSSLFFSVVARVFRRDAEYLLPFFVAVLLMFIAVRVSEEGDSQAGTRYLWYATPSFDCVFSSEKAGVVLFADLDQSSRCPPLHIFLFCEAVSAHRKVSCFHVLCMSSGTLPLDAQSDNASLHLPPKFRCWACGHIAGERT